MENLNRKYEFSMNVEQLDSVFSTGAKFSTKDVKTGELHIQLTKSRNIINLNETLCYANILKPDGEVIAHECEVIDVEKGIVKLDLVTDAMNQPGLYNFETNDSPQLVVLPDQYFAMNLLLELASGGVSDFRNLDFILRSILALNNESELLKLQNSGFKNTDLFKITTDVQFNVAKNISLVIVFIVIPLLFVILSIIVFVLRRVKNEKYRK